jgi:quercetin dioxygenase-like cupin family protein
MMGSHRAQNVRIAGLGRMSAAALIALIAMVVGCEAQAVPALGVAADVLAQSRVDAHFNITTEQPSDIMVAKATFAPGSNGGWHSHGGSVIVAVTKGIATFYDGDDPHCQPHQVGPGQGLVEPPGHVHITRNEGSEPLELYVTYVLPAGNTPDTDVPAPGNCPF